MIKEIKKVLLSILFVSLAGGTLVGCGSNDKNSVADNKTTVNEDVSESKSESKNNTISQINTKPENKNINDISKLKEKLKDELGEGELIKDISVKGQELILKVDLGNQTNGLPIKDLAETRYSSLTDYLLSNGQWQSITVDFIGVGKVSMDVSNAQEKEINGVKMKYFSGEDISENFKQSN